MTERYRFPECSVGRVWLKNPPPPFQSDTIAIRLELWIFPSLAKEGWREAPGWFEAVKSGEHGLPSPLLRRAAKGHGHGKLTHTGRPV
jgi:hypothetical protein